MMMLHAARPYWRIPLFAVLSAALAFAGSFVFPPTYKSTTRLLIHGSDVRFLSTSGQDSSVQRGLIDATMSKTLAETYAGMATSRSAAIAVVDRLHLDAPDTGHGPIHALEAAAAWTYRCGRAFVTYGYCAKVNRRDKAIQDVQEGASAEQLGVTSGDAAGQPGAFILEVSGSGETAEQARDVTNALADQLVTMSVQHAHDAASTYISALQSQLDAATADVNAKSSAVEQFETSHRISAADAQQVLDIQAYSSLRGALRDAEAELADSQAQLSSIDAMLATTATDATSSQTISTGRSDTTVQTTGANPVYSALQSQRNTLVSKIAGLQARVKQLNQQILDTSPTTLNADQAQLAGLLKDLDLAKQQQAQLTGQVQQARTQLATDAPELTRLDTAPVPSYPVAPKRYLYLALGLLIGGLAGGGLTWLAGRRRLPDDPDEPPPADDQEKYWTPWDEPADDGGSGTMTDITSPVRVGEPAVTDDVRRGNHARPSASRHAGPGGGA
jgi:uncharacterized protein involved in exopolysaccharide biosynthesis